MPVWIGSTCRFIFGIENKPSTAFRDPIPFPFLPPDLAGPPRLGQSLVSPSLELHGQQPSPPERLLCRQEAAPGPASQKPTRDSDGHGGLTDGGPVTAQVGLSLFAASPPLSFLYGRLL